MVTGGDWEARRGGLAPLARYNARAVIALRFARAGLAVRKQTNLEAVQRRLDHLAAQPTAAVRTQDRAPINIYLCIYVSICLSLFIDILCVCVCVCA